MERIKSITEAFSMQPAVICITEKCVRDNYPSESDIEEIKLEEVMIGENPSTCDFIMMYVAYGFDKQIKAKYVAKATNVQYF